MFSHPLTDRFLEHLLIGKGLSENTLGAYSADLADFMGFLEERLPAGDKDAGPDLRRVDEQLLFLYIVYARGRGLGKRSLARRLSALRGFFAFARE
ncbi:MAG: site-specific integrase, partial [Desulfovibrio sp.]|nr:site-specific integrase [Desulfovibrio sp.]